MVDRFKSQVDARHLNSTSQDKRPYLINVKAECKFNMADNTKARENCTVQNYTP